VLSDDAIFVFHFVFKQSITTRYFFDLVIHGIFDARHFRHVQSECALYFRLYFGFQNAPLTTNLWMARDRLHFCGEQQPSLRGGIGKNVTNVTCGGFLRFLA
jgi:hypothetical protein